MKPIEELKDFTIDISDIDELALGLEVCSKKSNMVIQEFAYTIIQLQQENKQLREKVNKFNIDKINNENKSLKGSCKVLGEKNNNQRKELQRLNNKIEKLKVINEEHKKLNGELREENQKYKEAIDKATDKCNKTLNYINNTLLKNNVKVELAELLEIKGGLDIILESLVEEMNENKNLVDLGFYENEPVGFKYDRSIDKPVLAKRVDNYYYAYPTKYGWVWYRSRFLGDERDKEIEDISFIDWAYMVLKEV